MDYCTVVDHLLTILQMIVNKTDTLIMTNDMIQKYMMVDEMIQQLIVREISADIGKVAQKLMIKQLGVVNMSMKNSSH